MKKTAFALLIHAVCAQSAWAAPLLFTPAAKTCVTTMSNNTTCTSNSVYFDFNDKTAMPDIWQHDPVLAWERLDVESARNQALRSPRLAVGKKTALSTSFIGTGGEVSFDLKVLGATGNHMKFYINDELQEAFFEPTEQDQLSYALPNEGQVTLTWVFEKHQASANHADFVWLDNVHIEADMDTDLDGFNDAWELKHFKDLSTLGAEQAHLVFDQDGFSMLLDNLTATLSHASKHNLPKEARTSYHMIKWLAIDKKFPPAMQLLGQLYLNDIYIGNATDGLNVSSNIELAAHWFIKAAELNHAPSFVSASYAYLTGMGGKQDKQQAIIWLKKAEAANQTNAYALLGRAYSIDKIFPSDTKKALFYLKQAVANKYPGYQDALLSLGLFYQEGAETQAESKVAFHYFKQAAAAKNPSAYYYVGRAYAKGLGVSQNVQKAIKYLSKATDVRRLDRGDAYDLKGNNAYYMKGEAYFLLSEMYHERLGLEKDAFKKMCTSYEKALTFLKAKVKRLKHQEGAQLAYEAARRNYEDAVAQFDSFLAP